MGGAINHFLEYADTTQFSEGVFVEITGTAIEIILLSVLVPVIILLVKRVRTRELKAIVWFYIFQVFHKLLDLFISAASVNSIYTVLNFLSHKNPNIEISSHQYYGNLPNKIIAMKALNAIRRIEEQFNNKTIDELKNYLTTCEKCIDEIDRVSMIISSMPEFQRKIFMIRTAVYPLRDVIIKIKMGKENDTEFPSMNAYEMQNIAYIVTSVIAKTFYSNKKSLDNMAMRRLSRPRRRRFIKTLPQRVKFYFDKLKKGKRRW